MSSPSSQPRSAGRPTNRLVGTVAVGMSLTAVAAVYLAVHYLPSGFGFSDDAERPELTATPSATAGAEADFANATCEDFDLAAFEAIAAGAAELDFAIADADSAKGTGVLYCEYTSDSGATLSLTAVADAADDYAQRTTEQSRRIWEGAADDYTIEAFDYGDLTGYTNAHVWESRQVYLLTAGVDRLLITIGLNAEPGGFQSADALGLAETMVGQVLERFEAYS